MADIQAITGRDFVPTLLGAVATPVVAGLPVIRQAGPLAALLGGAAIAWMGKGKVRDFGQGIVLASSAGIVAPILGGVLGGGDDDGEVDF